MSITYRIAEEPDGSWLLYRDFGGGWPARYPTRRMALDSFEAQRRVDRGAATRLGVAVRVELLPYP